MVYSKDFSRQYSRTNKNLIKRYDKTICFLKKHVNREQKILDLGVNNLLSDMIREVGYQVDNTPEGNDLDLNWEIVKNPGYEVVTAFQIIEHLVSPFPLLRSIHAEKAVFSVPLRLWFAKAYWNEKNIYDRHYHEFEPKQFEMLLEKAGWKIKDSEKWIIPSNKIGIRPLLRNITPRYFITYCERL
jgi:hypothetical protein